MTCECELRMGDLIRFNLHHHARSPVLVGLAAFFPLVVVPALVWMAMPEETSLMVRVLLTGILSGLAGAMTVLGFALAIAFGVLITPGIRRLTGKRKVLVTPQGITSESQFTRVETAWAGVDAVRRSRHLLVVQTLGVIAHLVSRKGCKSDEEWDRFNEIVRHEFETSRAGK